MKMTQEEFLDNVARLVAGLQVPVSMMPRHLFGAAYEPWSRLQDEATGGFGWSDAEKCREAFAGIPGNRPGAPVVVCLCGSSRFYDEFRQANYDLTLRGSIVLAVDFYSRGQGEHDSAEKTALDELRRRKIDLADEVLVVSDESGYFGDSTAGEIAYANKTGKPVGYLCRAAFERAGALGLVPADR